MSTDDRNLRLWLRGIAWAMGAALAGLGGRLVFVQGISPVVPQSTETTVQKIVRPARRGDILDSRGKVLATSRMLHDLYADPVVIGTNARVVAEYASKAFGIPAEQLLPKLKLNPEWRTNRVVRVEGGVSVTNWVARLYTNRSVLVLSNVEPALYARYREGMTNLVLPRYAELREEIEQGRRETPRPWDRLRKMLTGRGDELREHSRRVSALRREREKLRLQQNEVRLNALISAPVEQRVYPMGIAASHVVGYTTNSTDGLVRGVPVRLMGAEGIENRFDPELQGVPGLVETHRAKGRELVPLRGRELEPRDGLNVRLTIDIQLQSIVEQALDDAVAAISPKAISCVVVRPKTGEILAIGNRPTFDPNRVRWSTSEQRQNRVITMPSEPGSTFKMLTYAAAFDLGLATIDGRVNCEGGRWQPPSGRPVKDVEGHGLGVVTYEEAFAKSSNVAAAKLGLSMSTEQMIGYMERFGFLNRSGIMYSGSGWGGEHPGRLLNRDRINVERQGRLSYGYGLYVTPIQTAMAAAAIANDGVLMRPMLVKSVETAEGRVVARFDPLPAGPGAAIRPEAAAQMRRAMRSVVTSGTGKIVALEDFEVAGKTGTAHKVDAVTKHQSNDKYISTFVGYFPAERPELCILVLADEPEKKGGGSHFGGKACGPVFKAIAQHAASHLGMLPTLRTNDPAHVAATPASENRTR